MDFNNTIIPNNQHVLSGELTNEKANIMLLCYMDSIYWT